MYRIFFFESVYHELNSLLFRHNGIMCQIEHGLCACMKRKSMDFIDWIIDHTGRGWLGGAIVLGKLLVLGHPTNLD